MPSQVRIISQRNSAEWDQLVAGIITGGQVGTELPYGGITSEERADKVRQKIRTAARRADHGAKVYWKPCDKPGKCGFGADCTHHVYITLYDLEAARRYKSKSQKRRLAMRNIDLNIDGQILTITIKIDEQGAASASGKSAVVATTEGNVQLPGTDLKLGLNLYRRFKTR